MVIKLNRILFIFNKIVTVINIEGVALVFQLRDTDSRQLTTVTNLDGAPSKFYRNLSPIEVSGGKLSCLVKHNKKP